MALSIFIAPDSMGDTYAVYVSHGINETTVEAPTESVFDLLFVIPNRTLSMSSSDLNSEDQEEIRQTVFMPPEVHLGNGTYIVGVKLISASINLKCIQVVHYKKCSLFQIQQELQI